MSILVTAHEDKYIRLFDITTGTRDACPLIAAVINMVDFRCLHVLYVGAH